MGLTDRDLRPFLRDGARQNALVLDGWVVIRTSWYELTENQDPFVTNVREALSERGPLAMLWNFSGESWRPLGMSPLKS